MAAGSSEDARIKVRVDTQEGEKDLQRLDRGFQRLRRSGTAGAGARGAGAGGGAGGAQGFRLNPAFSSAFGAVFGATMGASIQAGLGTGAQIFAAAGEVAAAPLFQAIDPLRARLNAIGQAVAMYGGGKASDEQMKTLINEISVLEKQKLETGHQGMRVGLEGFDLGAASGAITSFAAGGAGGVFTPEDKNKMQSAVKEGIKQGVKELKLELPSGNGELPIPGVGGL